MQPRVPALRDRLTATVKLDATGAGECTVTARGDFLVQHTRVSVSTSTKMPTAVLYLGGEQFEGTYTGAGDDSDTVHMMAAGDTLSCRWQGGDAGATAVLTVRGLAYAPGQGMAAIS